MATLNTLRNKGGVLLAVVIGIALLAFVLGDMLTSGSTLMNSSKMNVGTVDGEKITAQEYGQTIDELTEVQRITTGREGSTDEQNEMLKAQAWDMLIREKALKPAVAAIGLGVSEDELVGLLSGPNVSPIVSQMFANPQTGVFDPVYLRQFVSQIGQDETGRMQMFWNYLQGEVADQSLIFKFKNLIDKAAYVTGFEAQQLAALESKTYSVKYVVDRYESVPDSTVQVTDADLRKYYDAHQGMFKQEDVRDIAYVTFEALPSPGDFVTAEKKVKELAEDIGTTKNVQQFVSLNSQNPFDARYYKEGELTGELGSFAFTATEEQVYGPVLNGDQWTLARISDVQVLPDSIRLSNIILAPEQAAMSDSLIKALQGGADFAEAAVTYSQDQQSAAQGGDMGMMDPQTFAPQFAETLKGANVGDVKSVNAGDAIYIFKVTGATGGSRKVQLGVVNYNVEASELTRNDIYSKANKFATTASTSGFEKAVTEGALAKRVASVGPNDRTVGGIQQSRELGRWAFNGKQGEVSNVMEFGNNFVIANITAVREKGVASFDQSKDAVKQQVLLQKKGEMLAQKMAGAASVDALAAALKDSVMTNDDINFQGFMAPEVGFDPAFTGAVSGITKTGVMSKPIIGRIGVYATEITAERETPVNAEIEKARLAAEAQQSAFMTAYGAFLEMSNIQDTRYRFY